MNLIALYSISHNTGIILKIMNQLATINNDFDMN